MSWVAKRLMDLSTQDDSATDGRARSVLGVIKRWWVAWDHWVYFGVIFGFTAFITGVTYNPGCGPSGLGTQACIEMRDLTVALVLFRANTGYLPSEEEGLDALTRPVFLCGESRRFLEKVPLDPWGRSYQYRLVKEGSRGFVLFSGGKHPGTAESYLPSPW